MHLGAKSTVVPAVHGVVGRRRGLRRVLFLAIYSAYIGLCLEAGARVYWAILIKTSLLASPRRIADRVEDPSRLYPGLKDLETASLTKRDGYLDVLILSGSVFHPRYGELEATLASALKERYHGRVRLHNLAWPAHTSRDSYIKYKSLRDKPFDLVIVYDGINEVRANNCPSWMFRKDYSHYSWYRRLNQKEKFADTPLLVLPYTVNYFLSKIEEKTGSAVTVPTDNQGEKWLKYGNEVKTPPSLKANLENILDIARAKHDRVLLMTQAYYVAPGYTKERFLAKQLDYDGHSMPIELWGRPANVVATLEAHNAVIRDLAGAHPDVIFVDQDRLMPKAGTYFADICHLTPEGCRQFVARLLDPVMRAVPPSSIVGTRDCAIRRCPSSVPPGP
jgi:hypothetical protein